jgi:hypothetical protein
LKEVLHILYANAQNLRLMHGSQEETLRQLAQLCPIDNGFAVYIARAALLKLDTLPKRYTSECEAAVAPSTNQEWKNDLTSSGEDSKFRIYPNPNNGQMTLEYGLTENETGSLYIYNAIGQCVLTTPLKSGVNIMSFEINGISSGLYSATATVNGRIQLSEKISILNE